MGRLPARPAGHASRSSFFLDTFRAGPLTVTEAERLSTDQIAAIAAGLGLFFVGIKELASHLRQITGPRFRRLVAGVHGNPVAASGWGTAIGFITQSGRVTSMILASLVLGGVVSVTEAIPTVAWANFGASLIVFTAVIPIRVVVLLLIGVSGICFAFDFPRRRGHYFGALFSTAIFVYGLSLMKSGAQHLLAHGPLDAMLGSAATSDLLAFALAFGMTLLTTSHMGVILIAVAMASSGVFRPDQAFLAVYGAQAGSSGVTWLFSSRAFKGSARQIVMVQILYNLIGLAIFLSLHLLEATTEIPGVGTFVARASSDPGVQAALVAVLFAAVTSLLTTLAGGPISDFVSSLWPPAEDEQFARVQFINLTMVDQPETALMLARKEQLRLLRRLPQYLELARNGGGPDLVQQHEAFSTVDDSISRYAAEVLRRDLSLQASEELLAFQNHQTLLRSAEEDLCRFAVEAANGSRHEGTARLLETMIEALDTVVRTAIAVVEDDDPLEREMFVTMTSDRGSVVRRIRQSFLEGQTDLTTEDRLKVLQVSNLLDRCLSTLGRFGRQGEDRGADPRA